MHGLLISEASFVVEHELQAAQASAVSEPGLRNCPSWALEHRCTGMSSLHRPGIKPMFPALVGGFLTTRPAGKSWGLVLIERLTSPAATRLDPLSCLMLPDLYLPQPRVRAYYYSLCNPDPHTHSPRQPCAISVCCPID